MDFCATFFVIHETLLNFDPFLALNFQIRFVIVVTFKKVKKSRKMETFGLELVLKVHQDEIKTQMDKVSILIHWLLLKNGKKSNFLSWIWLVL